MVSDLPEHNWLEVEPGEMAVLPTPVTTSTFFASTDDVALWDIGDGNDGLSGPTVTLADLDKAEQRLGFSLPRLLKDLYLLQNGGCVLQTVNAQLETGFLCIETTWQGHAALVQPFGCNRLLHLDQLTPMTDWEDHIPQTMGADRVLPFGHANVISLAVWRNEHLFLDYQNGPVARVGLVELAQCPDLTDPSWRDHAFWWADFDSFFARLRRCTFVD
ncbi:MAG: SMI1/KNR4 family protein [Planktomarina sp.]